MDAPTPPPYQKPEAPGVWMNFDNSVSLYHVVGREETFEEAARALFALVREAQDRFPDWPRTLYLDIEGHADPYGRLEEDFVELQQDFFFATLAPFLTAFELPLTGGLVNPSAQRNDVPDGLQIG